MELPKRELRIKIFFRSKETFWGKPQYYEKEMIFPESTKLESVMDIIGEKFPKYLYFIYRGKAIKNPNVGTHKK